MGSNNFNKKILFGFLINLAVLIPLAGIYLKRNSGDLDQSSVDLLDKIAIALFLLNVILLITVFIVVRTQISGKTRTQAELSENKQLLQSIIDNSTNAIFIKKIDGEYLFVNRTFEDLHRIKAADILGKKDEDFPNENVADQNNEANFRVFKEGREIKTEEILQLGDGRHNYLSTRFPLFDFAGRIYAVGVISTDISERKSLEESMRDRDRFFKMSLDFLVIAGGGFFLKLNPAFLNFLGYTEEEIMEIPFQNLVHPDDLEKSREELKKLATGANTVNYESRLKRKDGTYGWIRWVTSPDTTTGNLYAVGHDITERKQLEESLKIADRFFNISFNMFAVVKGEKFLKVNAAFSRILGYDIEEAGKIPFLSLTHPDDLNETRTVLERLNKGDEVVYYKARERTKSGEYKWLYWTSNIDKNTGLIYAVARDITEQVNLSHDQKAAVRKLFESEQKLKMVIENIGEGVIVINKDKQVIMANYMALKILNVEQSAEIGMDLSENIELYTIDGLTLFPTQDLPIYKALNGEYADDIDLILWDSKAEVKKRVLISGRPILDQENNIIAAVVTIRDISRYKQLEIELQEAESKYKKVIGFKKESFASPRIDLVEKPIEAKKKDPEAGD